tara:strand:- start:940 stop:1308 length:369 start_codon:yes stop_codon:yes gene_type:complete
MFEFGNIELPETKEELCMLEIERPGDFQDNLVFLWRNVPKAFDSPDFMAMLRWLKVATDNHVPHVYVGFSAYWSGPIRNAVYFTLGEKGTIVPVPDDNDDVEVAELVRSLNNHTGEEYTLAT